MDGRHGSRIPEIDNDLSKGPAYRPDRRLGRGWAAVLGLGWPLALVIGAIVEPAAADPDAAVPLLVDMAGMVLFAALVATLAAAAVRSRLAASAGVVVGVVALAFSATCPLTGHHGFGLWWVAQFTILTGMLGATLVALRSSTSRTAHTQLR